MNDNNNAITATSGLTSQQQQALNLLASGETIGKVSDQLKIHRSTIWRWSRIPEFEATLNTVVAEARAEMQQGLLALQSRAVQTLSECMVSPNHMVRMRAALTVLDRVSGMRCGPTTAESIRQRGMPFALQDLDKLVESLPI
jgi:hypothetical protein|tara:strand:- start:69 stop:494 length:426 start_codon:yes stop_codon:yes gene_type:complete